MKVFLDDEREAPEGWTRASTADEAVEFLKTGKVVEISLDHDLGQGKTGHDVVSWIEEAVVTEGFEAPEIRIHSANPVGRKRMEQGIESIKRLMEKK